MLMVDETNNAALCEALVAIDIRFAAVLATFGPAPLSTRPQGFATLVQLILEQQVSVSSGRATVERLETYAGGLKPELLLNIDDETARGLGISRQKAGYIRGLAADVLSERLNIDTLAALPDDDVCEHLTRVKGIGAWTARTYLLVALSRADAWPHGDVALHAAMQAVLNLPTRPTSDEATAIAEFWKPYRAVAARMLWHHYTSSRKRG
jgi:DNA-3-methyladenine glycosylase II